MFDARITDDMQTHLFKIMIHTRQLKPCMKGFMSLLKSARATS